MTKPFVDFYNSIGFAPTSQQVHLKFEHTQNRSNLYRKLGIHAATWSNATVCEVGPGSGENTIDLAKRGIQSLTIVDAVPAVLDQIKIKLSGETKVQYQLLDLSDSIIPNSFEVLICEGVIPFQLNPKRFAANVSKSVTQGGLLLLTTADEVSSLSEVIRRYIAHKAMSVHLSNLNEIADFFKEDFLSLPRMTRSPRDWVLDSILNPWVGELFSISDSIQTLLDNGYQPISQTPSISDNLSWYKEDNTNTKAARIWEEGYLRNLHKLIDSRILNLDSARPEDNLILKMECLKVYSAMKEFVLDNSRTNEDKILSSIDTILSKCSQLSVETQKSLRSVLAWASSLRQQDLKEFREFWGRGQQHILFERTEV